VTVWDGLPEDLKALFVAQTSRPTTISEQDDPRERDDDVFIENENVDPNRTLLKLTLVLEARVQRHMERLEAGLALGEVMDVLKVANKTLTDIAPWSPATSPHLVHTTRIVALETLRVVGRCLAPIMPGVAAKLGEALEGGVCTTSDPGKTEAEKEMESFWRRWSGKEVKGVKLF